MPGSMQREFTNRTTLENLYDPILEIITPIAVEVNAIGKPIN